MSSLLIKNCGQILTMSEDFKVIHDGFVFCDDGKIVKVGEMKDFSEGAEEVIDAEGRVVMPGMIDCHTHLVFAGDRSAEWQQKLEGKSYLDILAEGGGILSTVKATRAASKEDLVEFGLDHLDEFLQYGVTTVEIKSGYGLDLENELKILDVAKELSAQHPVDIVRTFLGAHVVAPEYKDRPDDYLDYLIDEVLSKVEAEFVDIFCEEGAFSLEQSRRYLAEAKQMGFGLKIHGEQMNDLGACKMAVELGAISVDHCDYLNEEDVRELAKGDAVAVLLPLVPMFLREEKYANGRAFIDAGVEVAISTDFNPGSCPSKNLFLAMTVACLKMGLMPDEALKGVTVNAAKALGLNDRGVIESGKRADLVVLDVKDYAEIPYWMGDSKVGEVICGGV